MFSRAGTSRDVSLESLGLCEHCGALVSMEDLPSDSINAKWSCSRYRGTLTHLSFGYDQSKGTFKKTRWVGPKGEWVGEKPIECFPLGNWFVL